MRAVYGVIKAAVLLAKVALGTYSKEKNDVPYNSAKPVPPAPPSEWVKPVGGLPVEYISYDRDLSLYLNDTGNEYRAVIRGVHTQDITVPDSYDGLPVTEIELRIYFNAYDNKLRLFVPKTVKKLDLDVILRSSADQNKFGRWIKIIIDEENPYFVTENRCVYSKDMTILWAAQCKTNYFTVPDTVIKIADHAFTGNQHIVEVKLPPSVKEIGDGAFEYCENLRKINVENVVSIGTEAFRECRQIRDFVCEKLHDIGDGCFGIGWGFVPHRGLDNVKLPPTLERIGKDVFPWVKSITVYDNLKAPLRSFANNPRYVTVRSAESGEIKFKVCIDSDAPKIIRERYLLGWREYAEFNFEEFDRLFKIHYKKDDWNSREFFRTAAQLRFCYPYKLSDSNREYYKKILIDDPIPIDQCFNGECDIADFSALFKEKIKGVPDIAELIYILDTLPGNENKLMEFGLDANKASELKEKIFLMIGELCREKIFELDDLLELIKIFTADGKTEYTARIMVMRNSIFPYSFNDRFELE